MCTDLIKNAQFIFKQGNISPVKKKLFPNNSACVLTSSKCPRSYSKKETLHFLFRNFFRK